MMISFAFLFSALAICEGFLLNSTGLGNVGGHLPMTDSHYQMLTDLLALERQSREQSLQLMETIVIKLQIALASTKDRVSVLENKSDAVQGMIVNNVQNDTRALWDTIFQMKADQDTQKQTIEGLKLALIKVQTDNQLLQQENTVLKDQISTCTNLTFSCKTKLDSVSHYLSVSEVSNVTTTQSNIKIIQQEMETINTKLYQLSLNEMSRGQDFLALLNQSNHAYQKLTELSSELELFKTDIRNQQLALITKDNYTDANVKSLQASVHTTELKITDAMRQIAAINEPVVLTACVYSDHSYSQDEVIKFPTIKTEYGVSNWPTFVNSGKFVCEKSGIYLFSVFVMTGTYASQFHMYKNNELLSYVYIAGKPQDGGDFHTGTGTLAVQLATGDTLYVISYRSMYLNGGFCCLSVIKIK